MRNTLNWKHNRRDRKQYMKNGMAKSYFWDFDGEWERCVEWVPVNTNKRNTEFMDLSDIEEV